MAQIASAVDGTMQTPYALVFPAPIDAVLSLDTLATDRINLNSVIFGGGERTGTPRNRPAQR